MKMYRIRRRGVPVSRVKRCLMLSLSLFSLSLILPMMSYCGLLAMSHEAVICFSISIFVISIVALAPCIEKSIRRKMFNTLKRWMTLY